MKKLHDIHRIVVVGGGTMGSGIAQVAAQAGYLTTLYDVSPEAAANGQNIIDQNLMVAVKKKKITADQKEEILSRVKLSNDFDNLRADVIIEAILENPEIKAQVFTKLSKINADDTLFCTNTSSIPITNIASQVPHPERVVGMHFFNPAHLMKLVEVVSGVKTSAENAETIYNLAKKFGKEPVMANDSPGFIVNRIGKMYHTESLKILEEGIASVETIDQLLEASGFKMGPFKLIDLIGLDANLNVTKSLYTQFHHHPKFAPSKIQEDLVKTGSLGKKSGKGFYKY